VSTASSTSTQIDELDTTLVAGVGDTCTGCGARLAAEQRYCVECGERRGQSRLPFADALGQRAQAAPPPPPRKSHRLTANGALIAGIGTLILALGVGVLIGRSGNNNSSTKAAAPQVIHVTGGGATGAAAGGTTTASTTGSGKSGKKAKAKAKKPIAAQTVQKKGSNVPPPAVKIGSPGHGKGYKNGKFTGDFFGQ
jgi:hypothetical protein